MKKTIKKYIPTRILRIYYITKELVIKNMQMIIGYSKNKHIYVDNDQNTVFLIGTPEHDNLGDHAIAFAANQLINKYFKHYNVIEITVESFYEHLNLLKKHIKYTDIIMFNGGGNFSDNYIKDELVRRKTIETFKNNKIMLLPQTLYFTETPKGIKEIQKTIKIYNSHSQLFLVAREEISFKKMKELFPKTKVLFAPDVVFSLSKTDTNLSRKGAGLILRSDKEGILGNREKEYIKEILMGKFAPINEFDTCAATGINYMERKEALNGLIYRFQTSELVVTDRLHGMILAAITSTPCIVLSNYNHKIKSSYSWVKNYNNIILIDNPYEIAESVNTLQNRKIESYNNEEFEKYFENIFKILKG